MIMGLRGTVLNQAKVFLTSFHHKRVAAAAKAVEVEKWDPAAVASNVQSEIDRIVASATEDPPDFIVSTEEDGDEDGDPQDGSVKPTANAKTASVKGAQTEIKLKRVQIENKEFWLVPATQDVMGMLGEYLRVVVNLPLLTTEAMTRVVEFLKVRGKLI
jgi:vacuolar protein sorting-associated protein 54